MDHSAGNVDNGEAYASVKTEGVWEMSILLNFAVNTKLLLKDEVPYFLKNNS